MHDSDVTLYEYLDSVIAMPSSNTASSRKPKASLSSLTRLSGKLDTPKSLFSGLRIADAPAPDNIIIFERTDTSGFKPEGVSNNFHHRFELVCAMEGGGPVRIGEHTYQLEEGDVALIFPNQFHHYMDIEAKKLDWLFITFEMSRVESIDPLLNRPRRLDAGSVGQLENVLRAYSASNRTLPNALEIAYHLSRFLNHMLRLPDLPQARRQRNTTHDSRDIILEHINAYVRDHLDEAPTIADLAQALNYSVSHVRTVFRDRLGISLGRYIRESRLSEAATLLQETTLSVTEISEKTGFESLYAFSRAFKNTYGISPKVYSQKVKAS